MATVWLPCQEIISLASGVPAVIVARSQFEGRLGALEIERLILGITLRSDLGFRWLAQRSMPDTP
jgi:hypothetical protein